MHRKSGTTRLFFNWREDVVASIAAVLLLLLGVLLATAADNIFAETMAILVSGALATFLVLPSLNRISG